MIARTLITAIAWFALLATAAAQDGFRSERLLLPPSVDDGLALQLPDVTPHLRLAAAFTLDYASEPLVSAIPSGEFALIDSRVGASLAVAFGLLDRLELAAVLPGAIAQSGDDPAALGLAAPDSAGLGELQLGASVLVVKAEALRVGLAAGLGLPTGSRAALIGDGGVSGDGRALASYDFGPLLLALEAGLRFRPDRSYRGFTTGDAALLKAGVHVPLLGRSLRLMAELDAESLLRSRDFLSGDATPVELLFGGRYRFRSGVALGPAIGFGLDGAPTTPRFRALATVGYAPGSTPEPEGEAEEPLDPCVEDPSACAPHDRDHDAVVDADDRCPDEAEDADGFEDHDGCPDADDDRDGVPDGSDKCPRELETSNGYQDDDGCPDTPPPPAQPAPEPATAQPAPAPALPPSFGAFGRSSAAIPTSAQPALEQLLSTLREHPELRVVVTGHASAEGSAAYNRQLALDRAQRVADWLRQHGIDAQRIEVESRGSEQPIADESSEQGRRKNRRVEWRVTP